MKNHSFRQAIAFTSIVLGVLSLANLASAQSPQAGWDYKGSHGMSQCEFEAVTPGTDTVNGGVVNNGPRSVIVTTEANASVELRLFCSRTQQWDGAGQLTLGPEVNYSGPGGGAVIGIDRPSDYVASGRRRPKGRSWTVPGTAATYVLTGGSETLTVAVQPIAAPVSQQEFAPVASQAYQTYAASTPSYKNRKAQFTGGYFTHLDSLGKDYDATHGIALDINVLLGDRSELKFLTGLNFDTAFRQVEIVNAPNAPTNGFNRWTGRQTIFVGPKAGFDWMPAEIFQLQLWGSLGALVSIDGTIPESQLPNKTLYTGESATLGALGYKVMLQPNFIIAKHLVFGFGIGLEGNATELPIARGPKGTVCDTGVGTRTVMQMGHWTNVLGQITVGAQF